MARAIWKGCLRIGNAELAVKMYSAVQDRSVHFRMLHKTDGIPVRQEIVRKSDGKPVPKAERRKAYPTEDGRGVLLDAKELDEIEPERSRQISLCRFVPAARVSDVWYDRPYLLAPNADERSYFALASTLAKKDRVGIVRWNMRTKRYAGALRHDDGCLTIVTFRRTEQIMSAAQLETPHAAVDAKELKLAQQLIDWVAADFEPDLWQDEYRQRLLALIEAKRHGNRRTVPRAPIRRRTGELADQLRRSLAGVKEKKVA